MPDTLWSDNKRKVGFIEAAYIVLTSGMFTTTMKDSLDIISNEESLEGITSNGVDTSVAEDWIKKLMRFSGKFTLTIKDSLDVSAVEPPQGISWDETNTPWCGGWAPRKLYLQQGEFTSTTLASLQVGVTQLGSISWDGVDTPWSDLWPTKVFINSGQFTSVIKESLDTSSVLPQPEGMSVTLTDTLVCAGDWLYLLSGKFTLTVKDSLDSKLIFPTDMGHGVRGIDTSDPDDRITPPPAIVDVMSYNLFINQDLGFGLEL